MLSNFIFTTLRVYECKHLYTPEEFIAAIAQHIPEKSFQIIDKTLLFRERNIEKFPLWGKEKGTTTYVASGRIAVQRFFWNIGWSKIGPSRNGNHGKFTSFGPNPACLCMSARRQGTPLLYRSHGWSWRNHPRQKRDLREAYASIGYSGSWKR